MMLFLFKFIRAKLVERIFTGLMVGLGSLGVAASSAWAEIGYFTMDITNSENTTFQWFVRAAETSAQAAIIQGFDRNSKLTEIQVTVLGERHGQVVPILTSTVSRSDWRDTSDIRQWTEYFQSSFVLLGFGDAQPAGVVGGPPSATVVTSYPPSARLDPIDEWMEAAEEGRISHAELAELIDDWD